MIQKMDLQTANFTDENIEKLAEMFPHCVTESRDEQGKVKKAIDFDLLKQELSENIVDGQRERYQINWPGKRQALITANTPINKTLRPCREESVDFDTTENLYIEGDNLDALKLLQESYLGKVKMIYIDPPYNTGKDFIYKDDFKRMKDEYLEESEQKDEDGGRLVTNPETNGRYHSDWLSMMYPRLKLARNLLKDDGVIFISIGEQEVHNLRKICDDIFGELNFIGEAGRISKKANNQGDFWAPNFDYILTYAKNIEFCIPFFGGINYSAYKEVDTEGKRKGEQYQLIRLYMTSLDPMRGCKNQRYFIKCPDGSYVIPPGENFPSSIEDGASIEPQNGKDKVWRWAVASYLSKKDQLLIKRVKSSNLVDENGNPAKWNVFTKTYLNDVIDKSTASPNNFIENHINQSASHELKKLDIPFDFSKPSSLIQFLAETCKAEDQDILLDFFSGSASASQAVIQSNAKDGDNRKFIMVQLPEETDEKSDAHKAGYATIAEIGKERIRRAGKKVKEDNADKVGIDDLDIGFRVLKIDSSNMNDVYYSPDELTQASLQFSEQNIKADRTAEDLLFQVLLDWGVDLSLPIVKEEIEGKSVYFVDDNALAACFDDGVDEALVKALAKREVMRVVFKDTGFAKDEIKDNVEQIFKQLSPETEVRAI